VLAAGTTSLGAVAGAAAAPSPTRAAGVPGWLPYQQDQIGVAFQYPPGWTVRILESGMAGVAAGRDGLSGARAVGQLFTVKEGTSSATLIFVLSNNLGIVLDQFKVIEAVRLSTNPDLSALRYTFSYIEGMRKGTLTVQTQKGAAVALAFDAPAAQYAAQVPTLNTVIQTFRWFKATLALRQAAEPREHAFTAMLPQTWRADFQVIRPAIDAGFVARATDPSGLLTVEAHLPQTPYFFTPHPMVPIREGDWYHAGDQWGIQPYLVLRYLPGAEFIRSYVLPRMRGRPDLRLAGTGNRPDLATSADAAIVRKVAHGDADGGEAEYVWTGPGGVAMRGRMVVLTMRVPGPSGGPGLWFASPLLVAEAPVQRFNEAVAALTTMNASLRPDGQWKAAETKSAHDRWRIILETQRQVFNIYEETMQRRQEAQWKAAEDWDSTIRYTFAGSSDYGSYVPIGNDKILTADGQVVDVIGLGGKSVTEWEAEMQKAGQPAYLQKAW